ncbi:hypothetical protein FIV42_29150 [Persicimonas caeni]|uniref:Uncharacterized protein n=1 Tax=Persicimonas caeni TaxID=2292766 RepID=A0A4Y6Q289_PERCE|nr:hypothetical protein [Persicimonas caeni]QDG54663.1 hypothetical protein FIV42_29150 [Persicimonas caeni]QED35884.1 hypothetical protein FRD00_29145 [Persicimonas caeni]
MARPDYRTPVDVVLLVTRAVAKWYADHSDSLDDVIFLDADRAQRGDGLADALDAAESAFLGEQREDVALTNRRHEILGRAPTLVRSVRAGARRTFLGESNPEDKLNDFGTIAPSHIRSGPTALKALRRLSYGMNAHKDALGARLRDLDALHAEIDSLTEELESFGAEESTENSQTHTARRERDEARMACIDYIDEAVLDAETCERKYPQLLVELRGIFDLHNPSPSGGGSQPQDDVEDVEDVDAPEPVEA